jgi:histidinol-phosphate aminotransferase
MCDFVRSHVRAMTGYVPGEQPREDGFLKLNTNENPYPPSPKVIEAIASALSGDRLRKYPDPAATTFRQAAAKVLGVEPSAILAGNGSDEILTILTRGLVPEGGLVVAPTPSYLLYKTLADIQNARFFPVHFSADWNLDPHLAPAGASVSFLCNPNSPSGTIVPFEVVSAWPGPVVVDEAYADFADGNCLPLLRRRSDVVLTRSLSKSYSLAGLRFGYAVADPDLIRHLTKIKDSYNCDALSLVAATAAMEDQDHMRQNVSRIRATRTWVTDALRRLGFAVPDSQANFVWARHTEPVLRLYEELKRRRILVRYMSFPGYGEGLRITIGTDPEMEILVDELRRLL